MSIGKRIIDMIKIAESIFNIKRKFLKHTKHSCPICNRDSFFLDAVDFNKSCANATGYYLPNSGELIDYFFCENCGFCFSPEIYSWDVEKLSNKIYNDDYIKIDPDYIDLRPRLNASSLEKIVKKNKHKIKHLDYGGGRGLLSQLLSESGWNSTSYDPFFHSNSYFENLGKFDLITAFEVFEHVPNPKKLLTDLSALLAGDGVIIFSTVLSDGEISAKQPLTWWYASPRNGHISLFSKNSLSLLSQEHGFQNASFSAGVHIMFKRMPDWAKRFISVT